MIINTTSENFLDIVRNTTLDLPKRWDGGNFNATLSSLFTHYQEILLSNDIHRTDVNKVKTICDGILKSIEQYYKGHPTEAFKEINKVMRKLMIQPLTIYRKSGWTDAFSANDPLKLFRIRNVQTNTIYNRKDIFHTPYNLRSKVSTCRYSISGFPSLYLGTSLELCCEEAKIESFNDLTIASRFRINRNMNANEGYQIDVLELALKPKDFLNTSDINTSFRYIENPYRRRTFNEVDLNEVGIMSKYLYWYPLIAACSYIRVNKNDPFASEYIVPQLLMQWIRCQFTSNKLFGIRYFSCASERASELGFNYIFPVSGEPYVQNSNYCDVLSHSLLLTAPVYLHEYDSVEVCERHLINMSDDQFQRI